ncbi:MAG: pilin [Candidatus Paceibacterota bacterium]|jgi:hypothetical protein|nr:pilin [Candidatus Paceibacterota bacterium]MDD4830825.1 pilin [Candidatus Paceibacterota bacterium]MDD4874906.1 pilin [Candidatus Paceibacterota bacterium]
MKKIKQPSAVLTFLVLMGLSSAGICSAALELAYPPLGSIQLPANPSLVEYLRYIFAFTVLVSGIIAFGMTVSSGIKWLTSAGNVSKTSAAKEEMFSSFLGIVIVLCSWLVLNTINPQLTAFNISPIQKEGVTVTLANANPNDNLRTYASSVSKLEEISHIDFDKTKIDVYFYPEENWKETSSKKTKALPGDVKDSPKSMEIVWKTPGVQLCYVQDGKDICDSYNYNTPGFGENDNKYTKIKIIDERGQGGDVVVKYIAIVFEEDNYKVGGLEIYKSPDSSGQSGSAWPPPQQQQSTAYTSPLQYPTTQQGFSSAATLDLTAYEEDIDNGWASSIKIYTYKPNGDNNGRVDLYSAIEFGGESWGTDSEATVNLQSVNSSLSQNVWSVSISGNRVVVFCENENCGDTKNNKCQIIEATDANLNDQWIGRCQSHWYNIWQKNEPCMKCADIRIFNK